MSGPLRLLLLLCAASWIGAAIEREPFDVFQERRQRLAAERPDGVTVLLGLDEDEGRPGPSRFRQQNEFYYLTGINQPGVAALLLPAHGGTAYREIIFLPRHDAHHQFWTGERIDPDSDRAAKLTGFSEVQRRTELQGALRQALRDYRAAYGISSPSPPDFASMARVDLEDRLKQLAGRAVVDIRPVIDQMRLIKSRGEVHLIQRAVTASVKAHLAVMPTIRRGRREYHLQAKMTEVLLGTGSERHAYAPIVAAGRNSLILHYTENTSGLKSGDLVLIDVGGEYSLYASDITRTYPVSGKFSERQREIYDLVLTAQRAVIAAVRPGVTLSGQGPDSLSQITRDIFDAAEPGLSAYFGHSVGHHVGLAVHDPADPLVPLKPGMVITIEPGLYLPDEGFGVRIEDVLLVTEDGARVLSDKLPSEANEIEALIQGEATAPGFPALLQ
jgi:Xaa-Pro aminopeptidase